MAPQANNQSDKTNGLHDKDVESPSGNRTTFIERETWANKFEFIVSCMAFCIGLGNVWRFPYLCFKNGGGAFFIPYFILLICSGIPIYFLEVAMGQYWQSGGVTVWGMVCPLFKGVGYAALIISFYLNIYYIVILSWAILYLYHSFSFTLPWASCNNSWNTPDCFTSKDYKKLGNVTGKTDSVVEFWERKVLQISDGIDHVDGIQPDLAITLAIAWILAFFCIWKGIKSTGKSSYVTAIFPYFMLVVLFIRGVTLPGAFDGIIFYIKPDFAKLLDVQVWIDAGTQIFFSYAIAIGTMTALGSYNDFHNDFFHQLLFICCMNSGTSIFAGFAIFSVLGYMAFQQGVAVADVADKGPGLAFIAYPKGVAAMPFSNLWAVLFFIMIILLGLGSQFVSVEGFVTTIVDVYPKYLRINRRREFFILGVCALSYILGLSMVTRGGMYVFQLFDYYGASGMCLLTVSFFESVIIAWIYKAERFGENTREMLGFRIPKWFEICWKYLAPALTLIMLIISIMLLEPIKYNSKYVYPHWAITFGWFLALSSMLTVPVYCIYAIISCPAKTFKEKMEILTQATLSPASLKQKTLTDKSPSDTPLNTITKA